MYLFTRTRTYDRSFAQAFGRCDSDNVLPVSDSVLSSRTKTLLDSVVVPTQLLSADSSALLKDAVGFAV